MFDSKKYIEDVHKIPSEWILWKYFNFNVSQLNGDKIKVKSFFNPSESDASMFFYYNASKGQYYFKDFSSGNSGTIIDLLILLQGKSFLDISKSLINEYKEYTESGEQFEFTTSVFHWEIKNYKIRNWNGYDAKFWTEYNIGSLLLNKYNVKPLESYVMIKYDNNGTKLIEYPVRNQYLYGYFKNDGTLYKIYQPKNKHKKFIKISSFLQGSEQLCNYDTCIIGSSLKDIMAIKSLPYLKVDVIAPDSENVIIPPEIISKLINKYKYVIVIFDNDVAGKDSMITYKRLYSLPFILIDIDKDFADVVKNYGAYRALEELKPKLDVAIEKYKEIYGE